MSIDLSCDWKSGFVMDPTKKQRVGYLIWFQGLDMQDFLKQDVEVFSPYSANGASYAEVQGLWDASSGKMKTTGIIESLSWNGGVGDPICVSAYISAENAQMIAAKMKGTLTTTKVTKFAWWVVNFDEENKAWFEEAHPISHPTITGQLNAPGGADIRLSIAQEPTKVHPSVDVNVYNVYFEIVPAANSTYEFNFATSVKTKFIKSWGLKIGTKAAEALPVGLSEKNTTSSRGREEGRLFNRKSALANGPTIAARAFLCARAVSPRREQPAPLSARLALLGCRLSQMGRLPAPEGDHQH